MKANRQKIAISMAVVALLCSTWACKKDNNGNTPAPPPTPQHDIRVSNTSSFGKVLTDSSGRTLYFFSIDAADTSACRGNCVVAWPVFYRANPTLDTGLVASDFATIARSDGSSQTTYKGWPLYYFKNDTVLGNIHGDAVGKVWFVAKPDYTVMLVNTQLVGNNGVLYDSLFTPNKGTTQYMVDDRGHTLYSFSPDKFKTNKYTKPDFSNNAAWPIDTLAGIKSFPSTLDKTKFDTLGVFGKVQLVYKGWPLYYFGPDAAKRGSNKGISVPTPGFWPYVNLNSPIAPQP